MTAGQKSAIKRSKFKQFPITKALSGTIFQKNVAKPARISKIALVSSGEVSEWLKEHAWKACIRSKPYQGFKSLPHRHADFHFILFASFLSLFLFSVCSFQFIRLITAVLLNKVCLYIFHLRARDFLWLRNDGQHKSGCDSLSKNSENTPQFSHMHGSAGGLNMGGIRRARQKVPQDPFLHRFCLAAAEKKQHNAGDFLLQLAYNPIWRRLS